MSIEIGFIIFLKSKFEAMMNVSPANRFTRLCAAGSCSLLSGLDYAGLCNYEGFNSAGLSI